MKKYTEEIVIRPYEVLGGKVRLQTLCNYMEIAAGAHAHNLGVGLDFLQKQNLTWVLAKMRLVLHDFPNAHEKLTVSTWPMSVDRLSFRRDFYIQAQNATPVLQGVTHWVLMNITTRKLERIPAWAHDLVALTSSPALEDGTIRLPKLTHKNQGPSFPIRLADIDNNNHVNNVRYIDFALEAAVNFNKKHGFVSALELKKIDILFRAEGVYGDVIVAYSTFDNEEKSLLHSLCREKDGQELAQVRTMWK